MKCNVRELALVSDQPCIIEGRLNYKKVSNGSYRQQAVFKERWFRLINNYLFYFKISDMGKFDTKNPAGVFVMENSSIQMEHGLSQPFSFSVSFIDEPEKRHVFAARAEDNVVQWVIKLRECSYEYLRCRLHTLQSKVYSITGKDPLLLVPRNAGACLWAPAVPFSTIPACSVNNSAFSCHLHTSNGAFTLERSKSDVQAHQHLRAQFAKKTTFYTNDNASSVEFKKTTFYTDGREERGKAKQTFALERSKTSGLMANGVQHVDSSPSIFDNRPQFSRAAPSPPARKKLSPNVKRAQGNDQFEQLKEQSKAFGSTGILDVAPVKPKRKISPKNLEGSATDSRENIASSEDLIQF